jgi:adenylate cyclase
MQRKLTAILSADVVGYSGLMEADEAGTLARLKLNRSTIFDPQVVAHGGRIFKLMGDGALAEFPSVIEAVNCALAIQQSMARTEPDLAEESRIRYRIGVNLGDIIIDGDDIYGDGVNVAARLQTLAPVGGIALSRIVREQVEGKTACIFDDMGEHTVKNIERPVRVFSVRAAEPQPKSRASDARQHTICVLPFVNMSGDPEQEYFSDGISEDIITDLSKVSALDVIARNTSFQFKGKSTDASQIARQLKASHILEGSVRKSGGRVRITAQLIDGSSGNHTWAERYDRDLNDIFALQDEISEAIVKALKLKLLPEERKAIEQRGTSNIEAYDFFLMARQLWSTGNIGNARRGDAVVRLTDAATQIDPNYAGAWALMSLAQDSMGFNLNRKTRGNGGRAAAERALALDANLAESHAAMAMIHIRQHRLEEAGREVEAALGLDAESVDVLRVAGSYNYVARNFPEAIRYFEKVASLLPTDYPAIGMAITCYSAVGDNDRMRDAAKRTLTRVQSSMSVEPDNGAAMGFQFISLVVLGEGERAKALVKKALVLDPDNGNMRYNFACGFIRYLGDFDTGLDLLESRFSEITLQTLSWTKSDPDLDAVREHPRFKAMIAAAEARLAAEAKTQALR